MIRTYAVIATANRPDVCLQAIESIRPQVEAVYVIDNGDEKRMPEPTGHDYLLFVLGPLYPPNLSKYWNLGLNAIAAWVNGHNDPELQWNVAIINDDAIVPPGWVDAVSTRMRYYKAAAACSGSPPTLPTSITWPAPYGEILHTEPGPVDLRTRMQGWAFMLAGEKGLRFDEDLFWWFQDDDCDWRSRQAGGMLMIPGYPVVNQFPNGQMTPELQEQASRDRATFEAKWNGMAPW